MQRPNNKTCLYCAVAEIVAPYHSFVVFWARHSSCEIELPLLLKFEKNQLFSNLDFQFQLQPIVMSALLYGTDAQTVFRNVLLKLEVCQMRCLKY